jgi:hypothetical protein
MSNEENSIESLKLVLDDRFALMHSRFQTLSNSMIRMEINIIKLNDDIRIIKTRLDDLEEDTPEKCSICKEYMYPCRKDNIAKLHCRHKFHSMCIIEWLCTSNLRSCPLCRSMAMPIINPESPV